MVDTSSSDHRVKPLMQCKVVMLGDQAVGKSSIINRYIKNEFDRAHNPTIGIDFLSRSISVGSKTIRLQLWDTAGQERFRSLIPGYLKNCLAALVVFDLTSKPINYADENSFEQLNSWLDLVKEVRGNDSKIYIIGNKRDMKDTRVISTERLAEYANREGLKFYEVSALDGENVNEMFMDVCTDLAQLEQLQPTRVTHELSEAYKKQIQQRQSSCC